MDAAAEAAGAVVEADRFGIGLRAELVPAILENGPAIDLVEVIADDLFKAPRRQLDALRILSREIKVTLHGVGMGLASAHPAEQPRLDRMARLLSEIEPEGWSEHLAFVRAGGFEIGHLAAPPRSEAVVEGAVKNILRAKASAGSAPALENIATLMEPPCSTMSEAAWICSVLESSGCDLLLDLHNLYANAENCGANPFEMLAEIDLTRLTMVHISGGCLVKNAAGDVRLLDDHLHDPPTIVYELLEHTARMARKSFSVILERDGMYPDFRELMEQLRLARRAVERGRSGAGVPA